MSHIIDRRASGKNKSADNRQRFLKRFKRQIKESVRDAIADRSVEGMDKGEKISIPARDMQEPVFRHGQGGQRDGARPFSNVVRIGVEDSDGFCHLVVRHLHEAFHPILNQTDRIRVRQPAGNSVCEGVGVIGLHHVTRFERACVGGCFRGYDANNPGVQTEQIHRFGHLRHALRGAEEAGTDQLHHFGGHAHVSRNDLTHAVDRWR